MPKGTVGSNPTRSSKHHAAVVELVDTRGLSPRQRKAVRVQLSPAAPSGDPFGDRLAAGRETLNLVAVVRIHLPERSSKR